MRLMNHVLRDCIGKFVVDYFDDILVFSTSVESHIHHLREVLLYMVPLLIIPPMIKNSML